MTSTPIASLASSPQLLAGWEPHVPTGDTILRRFLANWAEANAAPVAAMGGRCLRREDFVAADLGRPAGFLNTVVLLRPLALEAVEEATAALDELHRTGTGHVWLFSAWPTPDLRVFGWALEGHPPLMLRPAGPPHPAQTAPPDDLRIDEVTDSDGLRRFEQVAIEGYPLPELQDLPAGSLFDERALADPRLRLWLGWVGHGPQRQPVSAAAAFVDHGVVDVTLVATLPESRGRGIGQALTWQATLTDPALPALLLASDAGRPIYERMGYLPVLRFTCWRLDRPLQP